jgi:hypothetical protein
VFPDLRLPPHRSLEAGMKLQIHRNRHRRKAMSLVAPSS